MRLRRRVWSEKRIAEWDERDAEEAFVLAFIGIADNHPGDYMAPDEIHHASLLFRQPGLRGQCVEWRYEESVGAIHAVHKVQVRGDMPLARAITDAKRWAQKGLGRRDKLSAVATFADVTHQARAVCLYTLRATPADLGRRYVDLWDWDRDDVVAAS